MNVQINLQGMRDQELRQPMRPTSCWTETTSAAIACGRTYAQSFTAPRRAMLNNYSVRAPVCVIKGRNSFSFGQVQPTQHSQTIDGGQWLDRTRSENRAAVQQSLFAQRLD